MVTAAVREEM